MMNTILRLSHLSLNETESETTRGLCLFLCFPWFALKPSTEDTENAERKMLSLEIGLHKKSGSSRWDSGTV